jgi:hypothetical protein
LERITRISQKWGANQKTGKLEPITRISQKWKEPIKRRESWSQSQELAKNGKSQSRDGKVGANQKVNKNEPKMGNQSKDGKVGANHKN